MRLLTIIMLSLCVSMSFGAEPEVTMTDNITQVTFYNLKENAGELLNSLVNDVREGKDFAAEQIPHIYHEIISVGIVKNSIILGVLLTFALVLLFGLKKGATCFPERSEGRRECKVGMWFGSTMFFLLSFIALYHLLIVIVAPRMYVIEYLVELIKPITH